MISSLGFQVHCLKPFGSRPNEHTWFLPINNPIPDATSTLVDPTRAFKIIISDITEDLPFLVLPISYESENVLHQMEDHEQKLINAVATYKSTVPHTKKISASE